ncbi:receptor-type tyrosine-protein phosphatase R isoform X2 [Electrophorus electricus]|uniref:receptor-type tyrosine-protein phosphatase R isoform X2 n=1 Tax=Electrophorus electricus TaxID=8005 RepID=UPI0015CF9273|nr:receptor-type tyrosine-protein phosphatase R isoform X2 [Electrophorus electricus]
MYGRSIVCVLVFLLVRVEIAGGFSGDGRVYPARHYGRQVPVTPRYRRAGLREQEQALKLTSASAHAQSHARVAKVMPSTLLEPHFQQVVQDHSGLSLLARAEDQEVHVEDTPVSARHIVTMALQVDVGQLNITLLQSFRAGVAAALAISPRRVHINRLNEQTNGIELYVSSEQIGASEPVSSEEVIRSLNINTLHHSLEPFGITQVSSENVLHGQHEGDVWNREGFYVVVIFLTIFIIIVTCLMVLYRLKEKGEYSDRHLKDPGPAVREVHLTPVAPHGSQPVLIYSSMVQASLCPQPACSPASTAVTACSPASNADTTVIACSPSNSPAVPSRDATKPPTHTGCSSEPQGPSGPPGPLAPEIRPCFSSSLSPFKMKPAAGLQERRGSNVSLVLDMSALGSVEPLSCSVTTPRERAAQEYLQSASRVLTRQQLQDVALNTQALQVEFAEIPMNFVDPKDLDIPSHGTKNRYKTILPNPHSRVVLRIRNTNDPLSCYINANYIRGYLREDKAFIATQGPMINTVNDFWQMAWQDNCPVIVMITKLKEKNEKCVLYWPEKRGIYGKVEVLVNGVRECEHYTVRSLTLKQSGQSRKVCHYWYTSWPDHKTPDSVGPLLQLMTDVEEARHALDACGPIVVHCSAGIGRTGCFIATTIGCRQLRLEGVVDILSIVCQLRADRGGMIQTGEQYEFVHHALSLYESQLSAETSR